ncbi:hypothetical protein ACWA7J_13245 [Leptothrix sp. BB-4]
MTLDTTSAWPAPRVVARLTGSLPMGGAVAATPVHALSATPPGLALGSQPQLRQQGHQIDLGGLLAFGVEDVVSPAEADRIVAASEHFGFRDEAPGIMTPPGMRLNKSVHWVADEALLGPIFERIRPWLPAWLDGAPLHGRLSHRLNMYRYDDQDVFNRHTDGDWPGYGLSPDRTAMVEWPGLRSGLTMLLYLNGPEDGVEGGCTRLHGANGRVVDVTPRKGSALFFRHGFGPGSVMHEGR